MKNSIYAVFVVLFAVLVVFMRLQTVGASPVITEYQPANTQQPVINPTATVGWEATAQIAQATADEARRVNAQATAQHEEFLSVAMAATMSANDLEMARIYQTATYAPTAIPLTMTANAAIMEAASMNLQAIKIAATATADAPELLYRQKQAEAYDAQKSQNAENFIFYAGGVFIIGLAALLFSLAFRHVYSLLSPIVAVASAPVEEVEDTAPVTTEHKSQIPQYEPLYNPQVIPCTSNQWHALAQGVVNGASLGINQWEDEESPFTRETYKVLHSWFHVKNWLVTGSANKLLPNAELETAFRLWVDGGRLPDGYSFKYANEVTK